MDFIGTFLNKEDNEPLYYQLYKYLGGEIRTGRLAAGEKLPGKRTAAGQLGVSVNTVDEAYQMLAAEGYVDARPRSGFVVCKLQVLRPVAGGEAKAPEVSGASGAEDGAAENQKEQREAQKKPWRYSFSSGGLDEGLFPKKTWNRLLREVLGGESGLFARGEAMGDAVLREALAGYLRQYRGVRCGAHQVVVGAGLEVLTGLLARLLADEVFALEDPGYARPGRILQNMGVKTRPVPVDGEGMMPGPLVQSGAKVAYLTPSHQFPTGGAMPVGRRAELLAWAAEGGVVIEDDYDSEFRFDGRPLPCMQGLDEGGHVVYAGTFSRSLAPGLRAAYLVLPPALLAAWRAHYGEYACTVGRPEQHTLARLMDEGHFARGLNRMRVVYRRRRDALVAALKEELAGVEYAVENPHTGLYFVLRVPGLNAVATAQRAREAGVALRALDEYRAEAAGDKKTADALVLGYGGLQDEEITPAARALAGWVRPG